MSCHFFSLIGVLNVILKQHKYSFLMPRSRILQFEEELGSVSLSSMLKDFVVNICFILPFLFSTIFLPMRIGHYFIPFGQPLLFNGGNIMLFSGINIAPDSNDMPLEAILYHILIPFIIEKVHYRSIMLELLVQFFNKFCQALDLNVLLLDGFIRKYMLSLIYWQHYLRNIFVFILLLFHFHFSTYMDVSVCLSFLFLLNSIPFHFTESHSIPFP